jgi:hypothetical protein
MSCFFFFLPCDTRRVSKTSAYLFDRFFSTYQAVLAYFRNTYMRPKGVTLHVVTLMCKVPPLFLKLITTLPNSPRSLLWLAKDGGEWGVYPSFGLGLAGYFLVLITG